MKITLLSIKYALIFLFFFQIGISQVLSVSTAGNNVSTISRIEPDIKDLIDAIPGGFRGGTDDLGEGLFVGFLSQEVVVGAQRRLTTCLLEG